MTYMPKRKIITEVKVSFTMSAILFYVYHKNKFGSYCGRYAQSVMDGLVGLELLKKVDSQKGLFYFKTEKSQNFKAKDFAIEYLWNFHNASRRKIINSKRHIYCFDESIDGGKGLIFVDDVIDKCIL